MIEYGGPVDFSNVSGFYGAGSFLAWIFTILNTALCHFWAGDDEELSKLDMVGYIAAGVYHLVAAIDGERRLYQSRKEKTFLLDAQYRASFAVSQWGSILLFLFWFPPPQRRFDRKEKAIFMLYALTRSVCSALVFDDSIAYSSPIVLLKECSNLVLCIFGFLFCLFPVLFGDIITFPVIFSLTVITYSGVHILSWVEIIIWFILEPDVLHGIFPNPRGVDVAIKFPLPRSGAKLVGLDQVIPFAGGFCLFVFSLYSRIINARRKGQTTYRRLSTRMD